MSSSPGPGELGALLLQYWNRFWFLRFDPISVGVFRIFLGLLMVVFYLALLPNWERFYAIDGIMSFQIQEIAHPYTDRLSIFYWTEAWVPIRVWWWAGCLAAVLFTVGWQTRLATVVLYVMECSLLHRSPMVMNGEDVVFRMLLFYGMFAPLGRELSVDAWLKSRQGVPSHTELPTRWAIRAMQINFALIYAISLPNKLADDIAWWNGNAIYLSVVNTMWSRWPWPEMFYAFDGFLSKCFTYGTILIEGAFPVLVWFRQWALPTIIPLVFLHVGIAIMLNGVAFFSLSMVCGLWLFVPPDITRKLIEKLALRLNPLLSKVSSLFFYKV